MTEGQPTHDVALLPLEDPRFYQEPYAVYDDVFSRSPVVRAKNGIWAVGGYEAVRECQSDLRLSSDLKTWSGYRDFANGAWGGENSPIATLQGSVLVFMDGDKHARLRRLVSKAFRVKEVEQLRPFAEAAARKMLAERRPEQAFDVVNDLALPLSTNVISDLLGIPAEDRAACRDRAVIVGRAFGPPQPPEERPVVETAIHEASDYFAGLLAERRSHPQDDLISVLATTEDEGDMLSSDEIVGTCNLLFGAGHETTAGLIGNAVYALTEFPEQLRLLQRDEVTIEAAVEEFLRYDTPFQLMRKVTLEDIEIAGVPVPADSVLLLFIGAGNHDEAAFANPHELDLSRSDVRTLSFSFGAHFCLGAALARLEAQSAIGALVSLGKRIEIAEAGPTRLPPSVPVRGFEKLPVHFV